MDDLAIVGDPADVWPALQRLEDRLREGAGLERSPSPLKCLVYSPSGQYGDKPATYGVGTNGGGDSGLQVGFGVILAGVPVGDDIFVLNFVKAEAARVSGIIETSNTLLRTLQNVRDHAFQVDRQSLSTRLNYLSQVVPPNVPGVIEELQGVDRARFAVLATTIGIDPFAVPEGQPDPTFTRERCWLPVRHKGLGIVRAADLAPAAFVGAMELVVPRFPDHVVEGRLVPGLFPHLSAATGAAFGAGEGRWATLVNSGLPLGAAYEQAWELMRQECNSSGVFAPPAIDSPEPPNLDDFSYEPDGRIRLQRLCTRERARRRNAALVTRMEALPNDDMRRVSLNYAGASKSLFATLPQKDTKCSQDEFPGVVAVYLGLPDPRIVKVARALSADGNVPYFRDAQCMRVLDVFGNNLSLYMGEGHGRTTFHDEIQNTLFALAHAVGLPILRTPTDVFLAAIPPEARERFKALMRAYLCSRNAGQARGGVVPDLFEPHIRQMFDVKTTGFKPEQYYAGLSAVDLKAATVPGSYRARAAGADQQYNGVAPGGGLGPVGAQMASMPEVLCISVGALGEVNRTTATFLSKLADVGSENPERFGCCHGRRQAQGVVASFVGRRFGRIVLRGVVRVRHTALEKAVGPAYGVPVTPVGGLFGPGRVGAGDPGNEFDFGVAGPTPPPPA